jgi:hypothetical protein
VRIKPLEEIRGFYRSATVGPRRIRTLGFMRWVTHLRCELSRGMFDPSDDLEVSTG